MNKRHKVSKKGSKRLFRTTAAMTDKRNIIPSSMRGGIRM